MKRNQMNRSANGYRVTYQLRDSDNTKATGVFYTTGLLDEGLKHKDMMGAWFQPELFPVSPLYGELGLGDKAPLAHEIINVSPAIVTGGWGLFRSDLLYAATVALPAIAREVRDEAGIDWEMVYDIASSMPPDVICWITIRGQLRVNAHSFDAQIAGIAEKLSDDMRWAKVSMFPAAVIDLLIAERDTERSGQVLWLPLLGYRGPQPTDSLALFRGSGGRS